MASSPSAAAGERESEMDERKMRMLMNSEFSLLRKTPSSDKHCLISSPNGSPSIPSSLSSPSSSCPTPASVLSSSSSSSSNTASTSPTKRRRSQKKVCESFEMNDFRHLIKSDNSPTNEPTKPIMVVSSIIDNPPTSNPTTEAETENMKSLNENGVDTLCAGNQHQNGIDSAPVTIESNGHQEKQPEQEQNDQEEYQVMFETEHKDSLVSNPNDNNNSEIESQNVPENSENNNKTVMQSGNDTSSTAQDPNQVPFPLLPGEILFFKEDICEGGLYLTNYRLYMEKLPKKKEKIHRHKYLLTLEEHSYNLPVGAIDSVEIRDIYTLLIYTKYVQSMRFTFIYAESVPIWHKRISEANILKIEYQFCFKFYEHFRESEDYCPIELYNRDEQKKLNNQRWMLQEEFDRMGFDSRLWRICELNKEFKFSHSYPQYFVVPNDATDKELDCVANFRYSRRLPVVVWRSQRNGCVICRSSQPVVGWLGWRSSQDERYIQRIATNSYREVLHRARRKYRKSRSIKSNGTTSNGTVKTDGASVDSAEPGNGHVPKGNGYLPANGHLSDNEARFLILDARSYAAAVANRAMGGGCECEEYYTGCDVQFMGLANIHTVRKSFHTLRYICETTQIDQPNWYTLLDNSKWYHYLSGILKCAQLIVDSITKERSVLVHCSDGWDRTPQVVSLAELVLDPFYRTIDGFKVLIQREWLDFGHKFADRCRSTTLNVELNERCPVFLQWLDCVHQLVRQFPTEFEFNEQLLVKLVHHTYSGLFGTFVCNNVQERTNEHLFDKTVSFWAYLEIEREQFINYLFLPKQEVLHFSSRVKDLIFWNEVYVPIQRPGGSNIPMNDILENPSSSDYGSSPDKSSENGCDDKSDDKVKPEGHQNVFVTRNPDFVSTDGVSNDLNEANIDETKIDPGVGCSAANNNGLSQSKNDLTRSASYDSINKIKFDSPSMAAKKLSPNAPKSEPEQDSSILRVKHLSDTCLYEQPTEVNYDRDRFLSPSRDDLAEERPICEKISDDSSCDDNASTKNERHSVDERAVDGGGVASPMPCELFDIDGEFVVKENSNTRIQQMILYHKRMVLTLSQQLQNNRSSNANGNRPFRVFSSEERSRRSYAHRLNQELLDSMGNLNLNFNNGAQFKPNGFS